MEILFVLSRLLDYPDSATYALKDDMTAIINQASLPNATQNKLLAFVETKSNTDLLEWQAEYDGLFERGRSLGLWLFEHVHGESRDRGQAMVDLLDQYRQAGLEISQHELPDYIPLFLEFIGTQGEDNAKSWLQDVEHILALLQCRLENRGSVYSCLFEALNNIAGNNVDLTELREQASKEKPDNTKQALDKSWEEEEVTFGAESLDKSCSSSRNKPTEKQRADIDVPVHWVDFNHNNASANHTSQERN